MTTSSASSKLEKLGLLAVVILVIVVIGFVIRSFVGNSNRAPVSPERRGADDLTQAMACTEFNRAIEDLHAGIITDNQFVRRMQSVFNAGRLANTPLAREIFTDFQRARLNGSRDDYTKAEVRMKFLCHAP
jgi:hypothetical protein